MQKEYSVRGITIEDYSTINKWWELRGKEAPKSNTLPMAGLGGFVIEKESKLIAATYLYLTNSAIGYIDFLISDPNYKNKDRYEIIVKLIDDCSKIATTQGCEVIWTITGCDGIVNKCKDLGYDVHSEKEVARIPNLGFMVKTLSHAIVNKQIINTK